MYEPNDSLRRWWRFLPPVRAAFCDFAAFLAPFADGFGGILRFEYANVVIEHTKRVNEMAEMGRSIYTRQRESLCTHKPGCFIRIKTARQFCGGNNILSLLCTENRETPVVVISKEPTCTHCTQTHIPLPINRALRFKFESFEIFCAFNTQILKLD